MPKPTSGEWRFTLDVVQLNVATTGLDRWLNRTIQITLTRLGTMNPTAQQCIIKLPSTSATKLHRLPRLKGAGPYFRRYMQNKVFNSLVYDICKYTSMYTHTRQNVPEFSQATTQMAILQFVEHDRLGEIISSYNNTSRQTL
jgi:hypothetical protein